MSLDTTKKVRSIKYGGQSFPINSGGGGEYNLVSTDNGDGTQNIAATKVMELEERTVNITENGTTTLTPATGYGGFSQVNLVTDVSGGGYNVQSVINTDGTQTLNITDAAGGGIHVPDGCGIVKINNIGDYEIYYSNNMVISDSYFNEFKFCHPFETSNSFILAGAMAEKLIFESSLLTVDTLPLIQFDNPEPGTLFEFHWNKGDIQTNFEIWGMPMTEDELADNFGVSYIP